MVLKILKEHSQDTNLLIFELIFYLVTAGPPREKNTVTTTLSRYHGLGDCHGCLRSRVQRVTDFFLCQQSSGYWHYLGHSSCSDKCHPCCSSQESTLWGCSANICRLLARPEIKSFFSLKPVVLHQLLATTQS